ncbi:hypothetical protein QOT17_014994 [Balamuthia mandrillaris]
MSTRPAVQYAPMPHGDSKEQCTEALLPPHHHRAGTRKHRRTTCRSRAFPFQQFQALFTLFSKFFSSFPHARLAVTDRHPNQASTGLTLCGAPFQGTSCL